MKTIPDSRLSAVEPIIKVIGMTENGDLLVEDRNSRQFSIERELLNEYQYPPLLAVEPDGAIRYAEPEPASEPAPEPKKPRTRRKKG